MLHKLITLILVFLVLCTQVNASTHAGLQAAFDELNYALTVDLDPSSTEARETEIRKFRSKIRDLQTQGLSNAELMKFAKDQVKDAKVAKDLETAFNLINLNKMTFLEAQNHVIDVLNHSQTSGASWTGREVIGYGLFILIVAVVAIALDRAQSKDPYISNVNIEMNCVSVPHEQEQCGTYYIGQTAYYSCTKYVTYTYECD